MKKRICFISGLFGTSAVGGAEMQLYYLASEFSRIGHQVYVIASKESSVDMNEMHEKGIVVHLLPSKPLDTSKLKLDFYWYSWMALLKIEPDICIVRAAPFAPLAFFYAKFKRRKFIYSVTADKDCTIRRLSGNKNFLKVLARRLSQLAIRQADSVIAQTEFQKEQLRRNLKIESTIIRNVHPVPASVPQKSSPPVVLCLGNLRREKRIDLFVELAREFKNADCTFAVAGKAMDEGCLEVLEDAIRKQKNLHYYGALPSDEALELAGRASILVNTSDNEGFPNAFIEAWMRGTPTISLNVDPDGLIRKHHMGFHSGNFETMVKDVGALLSDNRLRSQMGENARNFAAVTFDLHKISSQYALVF